jgi:hypothetical protein
MWLASVGLDLDGESERTTHARGARTTLGHVPLAHRSVDGMFDALKQYGLPERSIYDDLDARSSDARAYERRCRKGRRKHGDWACRLVQTKARCARAQK